MPTIELVDTPDLANYYTKAQVDAGFAVLTHDHDTRYYTKAQSDAAYAVIGHTHTFASKDGITGITGTPDATTFLRGDGVWAVPSGGGGSPGGATTQIQYNNAGAFGGDANNVWDNVNGRQLIGGAFITSLTSTTSGRRLWVGNDVSGYGRIALVGKTPAADTDFAGASIEFAISITDNVYKRLYTITGDVLNGNNLASRVFSIVDNQNAGFNLISFASSGNATFGGGISITSSAPPTGGNFRAELVAGAPSLVVGTSGYLVHEADHNIFRSFSGGGNNQLHINTISGLRLPVGAYLRWYDDVGITGAFDLGLYRNAAGILEINNGVAGTYRDLQLRNLYGGGSAEFQSSAAYIQVGVSGTGAVIIYGDANKSIVAGSAYQIGWCSGNPAALGVNDTAFARNAAGVVEINNGTAGTLRDLALRTIVSITQMIPTGGATITVGNVGSSELTLAGASGGGITLRSDGRVAFANTTNSAGTLDIGFRRNAAGVLQIDEGASSALRDLTLRTLLPVGGTVTLDTPIISGTQTWNAAGVSFYGVKYNFTNTASAAGARTFALQLAGVDKFAVDINGNVKTGIWQGTTIASGFGGTGSAFFAIAGPTALRTYTLPDANATLIYNTMNGAALTSAVLTTPAIGVATGTSLAVTGALTSSGTAGIGYATGAGGTVTQTANKSNGVTLNKICGQITMNGAALAAAAKVFFVVTNSTVVATDIPTVDVVSGGTANAYRAWVAAVGAGVFTIGVENVTAGSLSEAPVIGFFVNKAVTS